MDLTNDSYVILIGTQNFTERYYRDERGWRKVSARGQTFRMTAEQVLNHLLPAAAGVKPGVVLRVVHHPFSGRKRRPRPSTTVQGRSHGNRVGSEVGNITPPATGRHE